MFEIIGLLSLYVIGYGWLWGKESHHNMANDGEDIYANGSDLFGIGLIATFIWIFIIYAALYVLTYYK